MKIQLPNKYQFQLFLFFSLVYKRKDIIRNIYYLKNFIFYENKRQLAKNYFYSIFYSMPVIKGKVNDEINKFNSHSCLSIVFIRVIGCSFVPSEGSICSNGSRRNKK